MTQTNKKTVLLVVLDGWGHSEQKEHNAIAMSNKPYFDSLWEKYPHAFLQASEEYVGLPKGQMGDSETGHHVIGAGRVPLTDLVRISKAANNGEFETNESFMRLFNHVKKNGSVLHVEGLLGPGGIHSHTDHLYAFLRAAKKADISKIAVHVFTDGYDTPPQSASQYIDELQKFLDELGVGFISTVAGRYYAMDRDHNWDRVKQVEDAIFNCRGNVCKLKTGEELKKQLYENKDLHDNLIAPMVCLDKMNQTCGIKENDGVFFFNFRPDRARMLSKIILERAQKSNLYFVTMTEYDENLKTDIAFPPEHITHTLCEEISGHGLTQCHIAESEKFAHATYFLNGGRQEPYEKEEDILVPSIREVDGQKIRGYDQVPEMRANEIADEAVKQIEKGTDFIFVNFANLDMVGHTGNETAVMRAVEAVDRGLGKIVEAVLSSGGLALITSDHGNAEIMVHSDTGAKHTAHTTSKVPVILTMADVKMKEGSLANIAPTVLSLLNVPKPSEMTEDSLIVN